MPVVAPNRFWGKVRRLKDESDVLHVVDWHPLEDHCADVSACLEAILATPAIASRFALLAGFPLSRIHVARLSLIAYLHDIGKGNAGFQAKVFPLAEHKDVRAASHIREGFALFTEPSLAAEVTSRLPIKDICSWYETPEVASGFIFASLAHHGWPENPCRLVDPNMRRLWSTRWRWASIGATLDLFSSRLRENFAEAFLYAPPFPADPRLEALFAGLVSLADWLGSNDSPDMFPFSKSDAGPRLPWARQRAKEIVLKTGIDTTASRRALIARGFTFSDMLDEGHPEATPNAMQRAVMSIDLPGLSA